MRTSGIGAGAAATRSFRNGSKPPTAVIRIVVGEKFRTRAGKEPHSTPLRTYSLRGDTALVGATTSTQALPRVPKRIVSLTAKSAVRIRSIMSTDRYELPLSTTSSAARDACVEGCEAKEAKSWAAGFWTGSRYASRLQPVGLSPQFVGRSQSRLPNRGIPGSFGKFAVPSGELAQLAQSFVILPGLAGDVDPGCCHHVNLVMAPNSWNRCR